MAITHKNNFQEVRISMWYVIESKILFRPAYRCLHQCTYKDGSNLMIYKICCYLLNIEILKFSHFEL